MSEAQRRIIQEQLQANERMLRLNSENGVVFVNGQRPINERVYQVRTMAKDMLKTGRADVGSPKTGK